MPLVGDYLVQQMEAQNIRMRAHTPLEVLRVFLFSWLLW